VRMHVRAAQRCEGAAALCALRDAGTPAAANLEPVHPRQRTPLASVCCTCQNSAQPGCARHAGPPHTARAPASSLGRGWGQNPTLSYPAHARPYPTHPTPRAQACRPGARRRWSLPRRSSSRGWRRRRSGTRPRSRRSPSARAPGVRHWVSHPRGSGRGLTLADENHVCEDRAGRTAVCCSALVLGGRSLRSWETAVQRIWMSPLQATGACPLPPRGSQGKQT